MKELKHETDILTPNLGQFPVGELGDIFAVESIAPSIRLVQQPDHSAASTCPSPTAP